jgi:hypothetical protein
MCNSRIFLLKGYLQGLLPRQDRNFLEVRGKVVMIIMQPEEGTAGLCNDETEAEYLERKNREFPVKREQYSYTPHHQ